MKKLRMKLNKLLNRILTSVHYNSFLFVTAMISIGMLLIQYYFENTPEWFNGGDFWFHLINNILYAFLASYIFYLLSVYYPRKRDMILFQEILIKNVEQIIFSWENVLKNLSQCYGVDIYDNKFEMLSLKSINRTVDQFGKNISVSSDGQVKFIENTVAHLLDSEIRNIKMNIEEIQKIQYGRYEPMISIITGKINMSSVDKIAKYHIEKLQSSSTLAEIPIMSYDVGLIEFNNLIFDLINIADKFEYNIHNSIIDINKENGIKKI